MGKLRVLVAYPGLGKSTIAANWDGVNDMDYGTWRSAKTGKHFWELKPGETMLLHKEFAEMAFQAWLRNPEQIIMTNEIGAALAIADIFRSRGTGWPDDCQIIFCYPSDGFEETWLRNLIARDPDSEFIKALKINHDKWKVNWLNQTKSWVRASVMYPNFVKVKMRDVRADSYLTKDSILAYFRSI